MPHTLLDIAKLNGNDKAVGLIEESLPAVPELSVFPARQIAGTSFYTVKRSVLPTVGFTGANEGIAPTKSTFVKSLHECFVLRGAIEVDKAVASAFEGGMNELEMIEAAAVAKASLVWLGKQIWYGTTNDAKGFGGLKALTPFGSDLYYNASTGGSATTASSVYMVKFGVQDATLIFGNNSALQLDPFMDQQLTDGSGNKYAGRVSSLTAWCGLQVSNVNCVGRIGNVTADSGKTLTDGILNSLLWKFPIGYRPDAIFMSRRSASQLQTSRAVTLFSTGNKLNAQAISDIPTEFQGIPIYVTDSIGITDAIET